MDFNKIVPPVLYCLDRQHDNEPITKIILKKETHDSKVFESKSRLVCNRCMLDTMKQYSGQAADYKQIFRHWTKILDSTQFENNPLQHFCHYVKELQPDLNEQQIRINIYGIRNKITSIIDDIQNYLLEKVKEKELFIQEIQKLRNFDEITQTFKLKEFHGELEQVQDKFNMIDATTTKQVNQYIDKYLIQPIQAINDKKDFVEVLEKQIRDKQILAVNNLKFDQLDQELPKFLNQYKSVISDDYLIKFSYIATNYIEQLFPIQQRENILDQYQDKIYGKGEYSEQQRKLNYYHQLFGYQPYFRSGQGRVSYDYLQKKIQDLDKRSKLLFLAKTNERKIGLYYNPTQLQESFLFDMNIQKKFTNFEKKLLTLNNEGLYFGEVLQITKDFQSCRVVLDGRDHIMADVVLTGQKQFVIEELEIFIVNNISVDGFKQEQTQEKQIPSNLVQSQYLQQTNNQQSSSFSTVQPRPQPGPPGQPGPQIPQGAPFKGVPPPFLPQK